MNDEKLSEQIAAFDGGDYHVTAAIWRTGIEGRLYNTYEIGIRHKKDGKFILMQSGHYNHQTVQEVANVVATMLADKTQCYRPEFFAEFMCP